jgi:alkaline phosphatase
VTATIEGRARWDTLVIVTADHSRTSQIVKTNASPAGASSILVADEGSQMMVTYGTLRATHALSPKSTPERRSEPTDRRSQTSSA